MDRRIKIRYHIENNIFNSQKKAEYWLEQQEPRIFMKNLIYNELREGICEENISKVADSILDEMANSPDTVDEYREFCKKEKRREDEENEDNCDDNQTC